MKNLWLKIKDGTKKWWVSFTDYDKTKMEIAVRRDWIIVLLLFSFFTLIIFFVYVSFFGGGDLFTPPEVSQSGVSSEYSIQKINPESLAEVLSPWEGQAKKFKDLSDKRPAYIDSTR